MPAARTRARSAGNGSEDQHRERDGADGRARPVHELAGVDERRRERAARTRAAPRVCTFAAGRATAGRRRASGMPSGSERQKRSPYARIVSATSWPTVRSAGGSGGGRSRTERLERRRHASASAASASSIRQRPRSGSATRVRDGAHLDRRHAGERRRAQDAEPLHRLDLARRRRRRPGLSSRSAAHAHAATPFAQPPGAAGRARLARRGAATPARRRRRSRRPPIRRRATAARASARRRCRSGRARTASAAASRRAVASADSTGPMPHTSVSAPSTCSSSGSVAATTRITRAP